VSYVLERTKLEVGPVEDAGGWMECITTWMLKHFSSFKKLTCAEYFSIHGATHDRARLANGFASRFDAKDMNCSF
jgi:hypothetical protein